MLTNAEVPGSSSAICSNALQQSEDGGPWTNVTLPSPTSVAVALTIPGLLHQFQYQVQVTGCDKVQSSWTQGQQFGYNLLQESNGQWHYGPPKSSWKVAVCTQCSGGYARYSTAKNATATLIFMP